MEIRESLRLAIPLAGAQVAHSATGFADTVMMGRMGADVLAGGGLASIIFVSLMTAASGVVMGVSPILAEAFGAGRTGRIRQVARQGLWLGLLVALPTMLVTGNLDRLLMNAGQTTTTAGLADLYLDIMMWALLPVMGFTALRATVAALSEVRPVMAIVIAGTIFNVVWNYILGFGKFGFPDMGLAGLAIASVLSWWLMFLLLALYILRHPRLKDYKLFQELHRPHPQILGQLIRVGLPIGIFSGLESGFFMVIMFWMGTIGTNALAAHQIVFQTIVIVFMVPLGISFATTVRVGQWLGKRDLGGIQRAARVSVGISTTFALIASIIFLLFPEKIIGIYLDMGNPDNAPLVALARPLLLIAAIAQVLDGFQKAVYGCLQGLQDTGFPMMLNLLGYWGIGLSAGYGLAFGSGWGSRGLWIGQLIATGAVAWLYLWRLRRLLAQKKV